KSEIVNVLEAPSGTVTALLAVADQGTRLEQIQTTYTFAEVFPPTSKGDVHKINRVAPARQGYEITDVRLSSGEEGSSRLQGKMEMTLDPARVNGHGARALLLQLAPDRRSVRLSGELFKDGAKRGLTPGVTIPVVLVQERQSSAPPRTNTVTAPLTLPGTTTLPLPTLPADWVEPRRQYRLELRGGARIVWQESQLAKVATVTLRGRRYALKTVVDQDKLHLVLTES